ncbi:MAG: hypothetical protein Kow0068_01060 [Marinilabiliales bacterium]
MNQDFENIDFYKLAGKYFSDKPDKKKYPEIYNCVNENPDKFNELEKIWELSGEIISPEKLNPYNIKNNLINSIFYNGDAVYNRKKTRYLGLKLAAVFILLASLLYVLNIILYPKEIKTITIATDINKMDYILPDGSSITLNNNSSITFPEKFVDTRKVSVTGEIFFDVVHDENSPFIIQTGNSIITVLGTQFTVSEKKDLLSVIVETGKVNIKNDNNSVVVQTGEKAIVDKKTKLIKKDINTDKNYLAWKTNSFVFDNTPLSEVFQTLENTYNINFEIKDKDIEKIPLTATFKGQKPETILTIIEETLNINISKKENHYLVTKNKNI